MSEDELRPLMVILRKELPLETRRIMQVAGGNGGCWALEGEEMWRND